MATGAAAFGIVQSDRALVLDRHVQNWLVWIGLLYCYAIVLSMDHAGRPAAAAWYGVGFSISFCVPVGEQQMLKLKFFF
jgi:hypothetical protein